jgi:two-component system, OmpR family, response regulator
LVEKLFHFNEPWLQLTMIPNPENRINALIIEDEQDICFLLGDMLENKNLAPRFVYSITEARKALDKEKPFVIFLDNHLPDGSGMNFIEEIRTKYPDIKIIMISAYDTNADKKRASLEGVNQFIGKPFTRDMVYETLDKVL